MAMVVLQAVCSWMLCGAGERSAERPPFPAPFRPILPTRRGAAKLEVTLEATIVEVLLMVLDTVLVDVVDATTIP